VLLYSTHNTDSVSISRSSNSGHGVKRDRSGVNDTGITVDSSSGSSH
jgi:hypothetical protein